MPGIIVDDISVTPLDATRADAAGIVPARVAGLPADLWGNSDTATLVRLIARERLDPVPALRDLFVTILMAELDPPADSDGSGRLLLARIDKLLELAALDAAAELITAAGMSGPEIFRRRFDIALLTGTEDDACAELNRAPGMSPTFPARIYCLVRAGDWQAAALTLRTAQALGHISDEEDALLSRFLDPELAEDAPPLPPPPRTSPLVLRIYEAIGEPLSTTGLPLAFAHAELQPIFGWKPRIEAGERLVRAGALSPNVLQALYTERLRAASGGVWERVEAYQRFDTALAAGDPGAVAAALPRVWEQLRGAELEVPLAELHAEALMRLPLRDEAAVIAFRLALLSPFHETAALAEVPPGADHAFLAGLARGELAGIPAPDSLSRIIATAFAPLPLPPGSAGGGAVPGAQLPPEGLAPGYAQLLADGRMGEALLAAMERIAEGATGDRRGVSEGLALLRHLGLESTARRAALQLLILDRRG